MNESKQAIAAGKWLESPHGSTYRRLTAIRDGAQLGMPTTRAITDALDSLLYRTSASQEDARAAQEITEWPLAGQYGAALYPKRTSAPPSVTRAALPTKSAMETALNYMKASADRHERDARFVSGAGEGAEIYRDAAKCIEFALSSLTRPQPKGSS